MTSSSPRRRLTTIDEDGWELESGEACHAEAPNTFWIPPREDWEALRVGQVAKLIFRIALANENESWTEVERMWVAVAGRVGDLYTGILLNQPATITAGEGLDAGIDVAFRAEHVISIDEGDREYLMEHYGERLRLL